ncbi:MAG: BRO family protein [Clostridium sp.]|uniref:phage antirepressor n=1 Tax=Clostridium sp. TaxID=1506 RepID=UPI0028FF6F87|nr:BRO family protein [Clostridium sp.]MDU1279163.1 BRO family protein [Clostridium sp.]
MKELQIFNNDEFGQVRVVAKGNEPWFVAKDVADTLGYSETNAMTKRLDEEDFISDKLEGMNMKSTLINESGLYSAILGSHLPTAKKFKRWVTGEVLPSIRKHGMYAQDELLDNPDLLIAAATKLKEEREARLEAEKQRDKLLHQNKLYTTSEIAKELGLSSATKLNNLLAAQKIQYKQNGTWLLYSKYAEMELVSIKQQPLDNGKIIYDRKWTGKGRDFILNKFEGEL